MYWNNTNCKNKQTKDYEVTEKYVKENEIRMETRYLYHI